MPFSPRVYGLRLNPAARAAEPGAIATSRSIANALKVLEPHKGDIRLHTPASAAKEIGRLSALGVSVREIGRSTEERPIHALKVGTGAVKIAVVSGSHADEPVGTATLLRMAELIQTRPELKSIRDSATFDFVPMANPDGSARNSTWFQNWETAPSIRHYLQNAVRDAAKNDVEWGYAAKPGDAVRSENGAIASWLDGLGPLDHYASLHSMFFGGGALLLVSGPIDGIASQRMLAFSSAVKAHHLPLHTYNRFGEKGHTFLSPGFQTAPTAAAMTGFFGAGNFRSSSMAYAHAHNQVPFAAVTEVPLVFDRRINSQKPLSALRAQLQGELARQLREVGHEAARFVEQFALMPELALPPASVKVKNLRERIAAHLRNADALEADTARYGTAKATEGNVVFDDFLVTRRRAELLNQVDRIALDARSPTGRVARTALLGARDLAYEKLERHFQLEFTSLEAHAAVQMATVLSGLARNKRAG